MLVLFEIGQFLLYVILMIGLTALSITVKSIGLTWFFALCALTVFCFFLIKYWLHLYIAGIILGYLGSGLVFAFITSLVWMTLIDYPMGPKGELIDWGWFFSFFYILWVAMGIVGILVYTQATGMIIDFVKGIFNSK